MARLATLYLWKEWRDQRATLGWLAAAMLLIAGGGMLLGPSRPMSADPWLVVVTMGLAYLGVLLTVGSDLLPGEIVRSRTSFLERLPAGLGAAFLAKFIFFLMVSVGAMVYGVLLLVLFSTIRTGAIPDRLFSDSYLFPALVFFGPSLWVFTVSAWVPRNSLAIPGAAVLIAILGWPMWLALLSDMWHVSHLREGAGFVLLCYVGAPMSAWYSFTRGLRFGRSPRRAACRGILFAVLFVSPAWALAGHRIYQFRTIDPTASDFRVWSDCIVGPNARFAFVTGYREGVLSSHVLIVDLTTGEWRSEGTGYWSSCPVASHHFRIRREGIDEEHAWIIRPGGGDPVMYDTRSALPEVDGPPSAFSCAASLPAGIIDHGDLRNLRRRGLGFEVDLRRRGEKEIVRLYDPFRRKAFSLDCLPEDIERYSHSTMIRPGRWLYWDWNRDGFLLVDPETGDYSEARGLVGPRSYGDIVEDGRVARLVDGTVRIIDPETGIGETYSLPATVPKDIDGLSTYDEAPPTIWAFGDDWRELLRFDAERKELRHAPLRAAGRPRLIGYPDPDTALVEFENRILRLHFDGRDPVVLFPRAES